MTSPFLDGFLSLALSFSPAIMRHAFHLSRIDDRKFSVSSRATFIHCVKSEGRKGELWKGHGRRTAERALNWSRYNGFLREKKKKRNFRIRGWKAATSPENGRVCHKDDCGRNGDDEKRGRWMVSKMRPSLVARGAKGRILEWNVPSFNTFSGLILPCLYRKSCNLSSKWRQYLKSV